MLRVKCPCGTVLTVKTESADVVKCPQCNRQLRLPKPSSRASSKRLKPPVPPELPVSPESQSPTSDLRKIQIQTTWSGMLNECKQRFGKAPRKFNRQQKRHLKVTFGLLTRLLSSSDKLCQPLSAQTSLFRDGVIVWGHLIQANSQLFQPGDRDLPGEMVYSLRSPNISPDDLAQVASQLGALKGTQPSSPSLAPIANYLTDEYIRVFGLSVPQSVSANPCLISTVYFVRHHLPDTMLSDNVLPLVVMPRQPHFAFVLPALFWPEMLLRHWQAKRPELPG